MYTNGAGVDCCANSSGGYLQQVASWGSRVTVSPGPAKYERPSEVIERQLLYALMHPFTRSAKFSKICFGLGYLVVFSCHDFTVSGFVFVVSELEPAKCARCK